MGKVPCNTAKILAVLVATCSGVLITLPPASATSATQESTSQASTLAAPTEPARSVSDWQLKVKGAAKSGETLVAELTGNSIPKPKELHYQWLKDGNTINNATSAKYKLQPKDIGHEIKIRVIASYGDGRDLVIKSAAKNVRPGGLLCGNVNGFSVSITDGEQDCGGALAISKEYTKAWLKDGTDGLGTGAFYEKNGWSCSRNYIGDSGRISDSYGLSCSDGQTSILLIDGN